ncbi:MAG: hypothetical protein AB7P04_03400 [Bacteriovoracia bacterium]
MALSSASRCSLAALIAIFSACQLPWLTSTPAPTPSGNPPSASGDGIELTSVQAKRAKQNSEILQEFFRVIYIKDPQDRKEFGGWLDTMNQGASVEGIYNGFVHSSRYRQLEAAHIGQKDGALAAFATLLGRLEKELPAPTLFTEASAMPLAKPVDPAAPEETVPAVPMEPGSVEVIEFKGKSPSDSGTPAPPPYEKIFQKASIYTLKRVLGDEALKVIHAKREPDGRAGEALAGWYARFAVEMAGFGVDFGLTDRNKSDEAFHRNWAMKAKDDQLTWEVLNRIHRVMNAKGI